MNFLLTDSAVADMDETAGFVRTTRCVSCRACVGEACPAGRPMSIVAMVAQAALEYVHQRANPPSMRGGE